LRDPPLLYTLCVAFQDCSSSFEGPDALWALSNLTQLVAGDHTSVQLSSGAQCFNITVFFKDRQCHTTCGWGANTTVQLSSGAQCFNITVFFKDRSMSHNLWLGGKHHSAAVVRCTAVLIHHTPHTIIIRQATVRQATTPYTTHHTPHTTHHTP